MFTIDQIKEAHSKVKSGADFPKYVQDIISLGVKSYDAFVADGHIAYRGAEGFQVQSDARYPALEIAPVSNNEQFASYLKSHQQGQTDYMTFCKHSAETGVEKWTVDTEKMTCTYYDLEGNNMLTETIPTV
jgi:uncharacterized protein YbcV (DUF1398 family)